MILSLYVIFAHVLLAPTGGENGTGLWQRQGFTPCEIPETLATKAKEPPDLETRIKQGNAVRFRLHSSRHAFLAADMLQQMQTFCASCNRIGQSSVFDKLNFYNSNTC